MSATEVIERLRAHEAELRAKGVKNLFLFGSLARGEAHPNDIDLAAEFDRTKRIGLLALTDIQDALADIVGGPVDLSEKTALKGAVRQSAERDFLLVY